MSDAQAYYDGLIAQNYAPDQALQHTQQYFPDFQPGAAAPPPEPEPTPVPEQVAVAAPPAATAPPAAAAAPAAAGDGGVDGLVNMLFKFDGAIERKQWWVCGIVTGIVVGVIYVVINLIAYVTLDALSYLTLIPITAMLWVFVALGVKRLRDRGREDKMLVIPLIVVPWGFIECGFLPGKD